ncbi:MAG TPA: LCP family protein [Candidatus Sulfomarinibacteraceae bacterium]|nr:LCP family protein [Candidatus Sulfomarinibacteraceae bacterium]
MRREARSTNWAVLLLLVLFLVGSVGTARIWQYVRASSPSAGAPGVVAAAPSPTAEATVEATTTPSATAEPPTATNTVPPTWTQTPTATPTPTITPTPSQTPTPSITPTPSNTPFATLEPELLAEEATVPTPVPPFERPPGVTNVLLLGNDVGGREGGRTDSMILVSINEQTRTATMLSLPRDLYVVIPGWKMTRINLALPHGHGSDYPGGGGALVKDTVLYNFGIPVDYYARIGFDGFKQVVDLVGGVEVAVSCSLEDWRLKEPDLDPYDEDNWEMYELGTGVWHLDGDLALWYVRSRRTSNDFERGRRQQQVLRAILNRGLEAEMLLQLPQLWETYRDTVETDMPLAEMVRLASLAPAVRENGIQHLFLPPAARRGWLTSGGAAVQLLQWEGAAPVLAQFMQPPVLNRTTRAPIAVEVVTQDDILYLLAADNLRHHGFVPLRGHLEGERPGRTEITYYGSSLKGSFDWLLSWVFDVRTDAVQLADPPPDAAANYRVVLGWNYDPCRPQVEAPELGIGD